MKATHGFNHLLSQDSKILQDAHLGYLMQISISVSTQAVQSILCPCAYHRFLSRYDFSKNLVFCTTEQIIDESLEIETDGLQCFNIHF